MEHLSNDPLAQAMLESLPADGSSLSNAQLLYRVNSTLGREISEVEYGAARDELVRAGLASRGRGRGGSVRRASAVPGAAPAGEGSGRPDLVLQSEETPEEVPRPTVTSGRSSKAGGRRSGAAGAAKVIAYRHDQRRVNNPEVGMVDPDSDPALAETVWSYDPHIDPALQFDVGRAKVEKLIDEALADGTDSAMRAALRS